MLTIADRRGWLFLDEKATWPHGSVKRSIGNAVAGRRVRRTRPFHLSAQRLPRSREPAGISPIPEFVPALDNGSPMGAE